MKFHVFPCKLPPPQRENKAVRGYYTRAQLTDAIRAVIRRRMTVAEAAVFYKIPRPTLQKKVAAARNQHELAHKYRVNGFGYDSNNEGVLSQQPCMQGYDQPGSSSECYQEASDMVVAAECEIVSSSPDTICTNNFLTKPIVTTNRIVRENPYTSRIINSDEEVKHHLIQPKRSQINRIVIKAPSGEILKQFVLEEKPNDLDGRLDRAWHPEQLLEELTEETSEEDINVEH
ncbi:unnamed protein product [Auanema sp. JU1783]|nr:unnamed protein product [Auanema sp. JU1783]